MLSKLPKITWKRFRCIGRTNSGERAAKVKLMQVRPSQLPKYWPEITWKNVPPTSNWCKSPAVEIAQILARNYAKERAANVKLKARVRGPAVEIAEILARNYVKTIQLDLESSGEIFMYLLVKCRKLWTFVEMTVRTKNCQWIFREINSSKSNNKIFTWN